MPASAARPKRAGEDFARAYESTAKKPRFDHRNPSTLVADAPEEDIILDADVIGKSGLQTKRNAVNIDGYESDSDNDNFDRRAAARERRNEEEAANLKKDKDEEEDDMFADVERDVTDTANRDNQDSVAQGKKKDVRFLEQTEIEGQVMSSKSGGHVSLPDKNDEGRQQDVESSSESGSDEERDQLPKDMDADLAAEVGAGGKKKHAPRLDAFNLKEEEEEGRFDESGNFIRKAADPDAINDSWLEGLTKKEMKRAREAQEKRELEQRRRAAEDDATLTADLLSTLIAQLETGETPLEALARLGRAKPRDTKSKLPKWKQKKMHKDKMEVDQPPGNENGTTKDAAESARRNAVETITGAADALYSRGQHDIYDTERELMIRQYKRETGDDWEPDIIAEAGHDTTEGEHWEYRWSDARDGGEHHGPYDAPTMKAWNAAGYFGEGVEFRRTTSSEWSRLLDIR
ncbi:MAG: hypothetical protein FE78DRAFT_137082 [Acidomyces sp. 'richmondensis']|nr:MAG: hypothetical protein FE78DRAFT_137082 [Acidomyces sp. 'richmondensis']